MAFYSYIFVHNSDFQFQNELGSKITDQMKWVLDTILGLGQFSLEALADK